VTGDERPEGEKDPTAGGVAPVSPPAGTGGHPDLDSNVSPAAGNPHARWPRRDKGPLERSGEQKHGGGTGASVTHPDPGQGSRGK
jgi:hypothetical protein